VAYFIDNGTRPTRPHVPDGNWCRWAVVKPAEKVGAFT